MSELLDVLMATLQLQPEQESVLDSTMTVWQVLLCATALSAVLYMTLASLIRYVRCQNAQWFATSPVIGLRNEIGGLTRATVKSMFKTKDWAFEGYSKYSKQNIPFVIPSMDRGAMVVIPPEQIKQVYNYSESVVDIHHTADGTIQSKWTLGDSKIKILDFQMNVIRTHITRNLNILTPIIAQEIKVAFEKCWGSSTEYKEILVWDSCLRLVGAASNSVFMGTSLCHDDEFLRQLPGHGMSVLGGGMVINLTPRLLKPLVGLFVMINCRIRAARLAKRCMPLIKERLANTARSNEDHEFKWTPPDDGLQWMINECYKTGDPEQLEPGRICTRILFLSVVSLHSTSFTAQNVILDLYSADPAMSYIDKLREEARTVLAEAGGLWTREAVQKLTLIDSTIRESMRMNPFAIVALPRTIVKEGGVTLENFNMRVPKGQIIGVPLEPIHFDDNLYPNAHTFRPFRFIEQGGTRSIFDKIKTDSNRAEQPTTSATESSKNLKKAATLDEAFLGFGFGRNACPGRFFALNEVKVLVAHMVLNYDVEHIKVRPKSIDSVWIKLPFHGAKIRMRRRVDRVDDRPTCRG